MTPVTVTKEGKALRWIMAVNDGNSMLHTGAALLISGGGMRVSPPALPAACAASSAVSCSCRQAAAPLSGFNSLPNMCGAVHDGFNLKITFKILK